MRRGVVLGVVAVLVLWLGIGWYYASQALAPGGPRDTTFDRVVVGAVEDGRITITRQREPDGNDAELRSVGLLYAGGYGRLGGEVVVAPCPPPMAEAECVTRDFELVAGIEPAPSVAVRVDEYAFPPGDPQGALGVEVQDLDVEIPLGLAPAWWVPPSGTDVVAVLVHGRGASRDEMLRIASILQPLGIGLLVPSHRGDGVAPDPEDGLGRFGTAEWLDVAMAMLHPAVPGDARFVLVGSSQGAGVVASLLRHADVADRVDALVLDSPLLGLDRTMQLQARLAGIPNVVVRPVLEAAYLVARARGFDFALGEHVEFLAGLDLPTLLFHGPDDTFVPVGPSDELAALDPHDVTYVRVPGVDHARFWNDDPVAYAEALVAFLDLHVAAASD